MKRSVEKARAWRQRSAQAYESKRRKRVAQQNREGAGEFRTGNCDLEKAEDRVGLRTSTLRRGATPGGSDRPSSGAGYGRTRQALKGRSKKRAKQYRDEYVPKRRAFLKEHPTCEIRWDSNCEVRSRDVHHVAGRNGARLTLSDDWRATCRRCHSQLETRRAEARRRGFLRRRT